MDLTPGPEVYLAAALAQQVAWRPDEDPDWQRRIAERMATEPGFRVVVDLAYRAGREDAARDVEKMCDCVQLPDPSLLAECEYRKAALVARGADQVNQPRTPSGCDGEDSPEEQAPIDMGYMSLPVETQRALEIAARSAAQDNPEEQR